eukprot:1221982-Ditylum_brightwellii.AAC.1
MHMTGKTFYPITESCNVTKTIAYGQSWRQLLFPATVDGVDALKYCKTCLLHVDRYGYHTLILRCLEGEKRQ